MYRCPREQCERLFVARYVKCAEPNRYAFKECLPRNITDAALSPAIQGVSAKFCDIYKQADNAEQQSLSLICGPGYRKALEFLIKDYLCALEPSRAEDIKRTALATCIKNHVTNPKIVAVASRAAWLGNDETHYLRAWEDKDLTDLKKLIALTVHWIEMEELTKDIVIEMPTPAKASSPA